ncbi:allantoinase AllB [Aciduricibacillus chroicocephali]|uniref:Allantoinase n=1 Tax=Aciduricibacillus chroicocephali TaxID=3054939 RepID=A0ABY9KTD2_9BACI|nr:allantoinase AllB [Bacillaceae bacterium 44XB]
MKYDLIVKNGIVVFRDESRSAEIAVKDGKIAAIADQFDEDAAEEVLDAKGQYVMPGMVDTHVHINEPGRTEWEGFETATKAMAAGGTTTCVDMPLNALPATTSKTAFDKKLEAAKGKTWIDVGFYGGLVPYNLDDLQDLADAGVLAFKAFIATCGNDEIPGDFKDIDDYSLYKGMQKLAELDRILCVHSENASITDNLAIEMVNKGKTSVYDYVASRPVVTELEAIQRCLLFAKETGCKLHIVHVACAEGVEMIKSAQEEGLDVTMETCTHYLALNTDDFARIGNKAKCSPPIRDLNEQKRLWEKVKAGDVAWITSDHSPCTEDLKQGNVFEAWGGISGCQNSVDLMFDLAVNEHNMAVHEFVKCITYNPCRRFNLPQKGEIALGKDADLVLLDPDASYVLKSENLYYKNKFSAYEGTKINCRVTRTILRGNTIFELDRGIEEGAIGEFLTYPKQ